MKRRSGERGSCAEAPSQGPGRRAPLPAVGAGFPAPPCTGCASSPHAGPGSLPKTFLGRRFGARLRPGSGERAPCPALCLPGGSVTGLAGGSVAGPTQNSPRMSGSGVLSPPLIPLLCRFHVKAVSPNTGKMSPRPSAHVAVRKALSALSGFAWSHASAGARGSPLSDERGGRGGALAGRAVATGEVSSCATAFSAFPRRPLGMSGVK